MTSFYLPAVPLCTKILLLFVVYFLFYKVLLLLYSKCNVHELLNLLTGNLAHYGLLTFCELSFIILCAVFFYFLFFFRFKLFNWTCYVYALVTLLTCTFVICYIKILKKYINIDFIVNFKCIAVCRGQVRASVYGFSFLIFCDVCCIVLKTVVEKWIKGNLVLLYSASMLTKKVGLKKWYRCKNQKNSV